MRDIDVFTKLLALKRLFDSRGSCRIRIDLLSSCRASLRFHVARLGFPPFSLTPESFALASVNYGETRGDLGSQMKTGLRLFGRTPDKTIARAFHYVALT